MQACFLVLSLVSLIIVLLDLFFFIINHLSYEGSYIFGLGFITIGVFLILDSSIGSSLLKETDEKQVEIEETQVEAEREAVPADEILVDDSLPNSIFDSLFQKEEESEEVPSKPSKTDSTVIFTEND